MQFEYKMVSMPSIEEMNELGKDGWELAGFGLSSRADFYFKRKK